VVHTVAVFRRPGLALALTLVPLLVAAACSHDGRDLAPVRPGQTTTTATVPVFGSGTVAFTLGSPAWQDGAAIPTRYTCAGEGVSPPLQWIGTPGAAQLALVVRDRDANGFVHWMVTDIDPTISGFGDGGVPEGAVEQANSKGAIGWTPPCPPAGSGRHVYDFVLHVLDAPLQIDPGLPADEAARLIEDASTVEAHLSGTVTPDDTPAVGSR